MSGPSCKPMWSVRLNAKVVRPIPSTPDAGAVAAMFGLTDGHVETLYEQFDLEIRPGEIVAVVGPSGGGKSVLLRQVARKVRGAVRLRAESLVNPTNRSGGGPAAVDVLSGGTLAERLEILSRCGLAEAAALITPVRFLSGGQLYRLRLAEVLFVARRRGRPTLVIVDEFAASLDDETATVLSRQIRKLLRGSAVGMLLATPRAELLGALQPDQIVVKPLAEPARKDSKFGAGGGSPPRSSAAGSAWRIERGTLADYKSLACFHYLAGPPALHKRVYVIRTPACRSRWGTPAVAAVLVVSPPVKNCRGRSIATDGRYNRSDHAAALALLNAEIECISRVIVHPIYRGCGLAVKLIRHAIATAETPLVEALAAMGTIHPLFERAGMRAYHIGLDVHLARLLSAAEAVGLSARDLAAVRPVGRVLRRGGSAAAGFLQKELNLSIARTLPPELLARLADPVAELCRRTARQYVYFLTHKPKELTRCRQRRNPNPKRARCR